MTDTAPEKFACYVRARAHPGRGDDLIKGYDPVFAQVADEDGTELYSLIRSVDDPDLFFCFELFRSRADFDAHRARSLAGHDLDELNAATAERDFVWGIPVRTKTTLVGPPREDRQAVEDLITDYARALDTQDWDLLRSTFAPDARTTMETVGTYESCDALVADIAPRLTDFATLQHFVTNVAVRVQGDTASASSHFVSHHIPKDGASYTHGGTFTFDAVRTAQGWRIAAHTCRLLWTLGDPTQKGQGA
ncbi:nuclear transport factor 2 family protein [Streptomyces sp. NPDC096311]|uniref:nuclear transport factor 2 family protein n=1 Tax=Streptomyces sp. NPDC096311 TaxID=3366083 RepID=UPI0037F44A4B